MLIGYGQPALTPSVQGATAINLGALVDGRPASIVRVSGSAGSVRLRADWVSPTQVGIVALLGVTCAAGTALTLTGRRPGDAGYASPLVSEVVRTLVDGSRAAWAILPAGTPPLVGLQVEIAAQNLDVVSWSYCRQLTCRSSWNGKQAGSIPAASSEPWAVASTSLPGGHTGDCRLRWCRTNWRPCVGPRWPKEWTGTD